MKIGVFMESFKLPLDESIAVASKMGIQGMQMYGESVINMSNAQRIELKNKLEDNNLKLCCFGGGMGHRMFYYPEETGDRIDKLKKIMDAANQLAVPVVMTHIGVIPASKENKRYETMKKVYKTIADYAGDAGVKFAIETGPEPSIVMKNFLDDVNSKGGAANLDPANLAMVQGEDAVSAVYNLKDYIVHTHAKDGKMFKKSDAEALYIPDVVGVDRQEDGRFLETPLGEGDVDWDKYLLALKDIGYNSFLTIEREVGDKPQEDIGWAVKFLSEKLKNI